MSKRISRAAQPGPSQPRLWTSATDVAAALVVTRAALLAAGLAALAYHAAGGGVTAFHQPHPATSRLLEMWARWDSEWYLQIAQHGYAGPLPGPAVFDMRPNFFPLYPLALRVAAMLVGDPVSAGVLLSNVALFTALIVLHGWTWRRLDRRAARGLVWVYAAFPTSFFLSSVYAESLLLACLVVTWWAMDRHRWTAAGVCVAAATLCRPVGIIAAPVAMVVAARDARWRPGDMFRRVLAIAVPVALALAAYALVFAYLLHDPGAALRTETLTRTGFRWPWTTLVDAWRQGIEWYSYERGTLDWVVAVLAVVLLPLVFLTLDAATATFTALMVLFPLTSGLYSYSRLVLPAFPLFVVVAARSPNRLLIPLLVASLVLQAWLFSQFVRWEWIA